MDADTLTRLLRGEHLSVPERIRRGAWPHPPLRMSELVQRLSEVLEQQSRFPDAHLGAPPGAPAAEGVFIERQAPGRFICRSRRTFPSFEESDSAFSSAEEAARFYLQWGLNLPGDLDGWQVVE
jgi:hypothetical protein